MDPEPPPAGPDPWDWSTATITSHLCGPTGPLARAFGPLPATTELATRLHAQLIQGVDLLCETSLDDLRTELGIQPKGMRRVVKNAILALRARSAKFAEWETGNVPPQLVYGHRASTVEGPRYLSYYGQPSATPAPVMSVEAEVKPRVETPRLLTFPGDIRAGSNGESPMARRAQPPTPVQSFEQRASQLLPESSASATLPLANQASSPPALTNGISHRDVEGHGVSGFEESGRAPRQNEHFVTDSTGAKRRRLQLVAPQITDQSEAQNLGQKAGEATDVNATGAKESRLELSAPLISGQPKNQNLGQEARATADTEATIEFEYFGPKALPVNELFYGDTPMGQHTYHDRISRTEREILKQDRDLEPLDLGQDDTTGDKLESKVLFRLEDSLEKPPGQTQYVNRRMKYFFLRNDSRNPMAVQQGNEKRLALIPYGERLASRLRRDVASLSVLKGDLWHRVSREEWLDDVASTEAASADAASNKDAAQANDPYRYLDLDKYVRAGEKEQSEDAISVAGDTDSENEPAVVALRREIDEAMKEEEREKSRRLPTPKLTAAEISDAIAEARSAFLEDWRRRKVPSLEKGACTLWKQSRDRKRGKALKWACHGEIQRLERRLNRFVGDLERGEWHGKAAVVTQTEILEVTWADIAKEQWKLRVMARPTAPPRPPKATRAPASKALKYRHAEEENVDILESDEDGFIDDSMVDPEGGVSAEPFVPLQDDLSQPNQELPVNEVAKANEQLPDAQDDEPQPNREDPAIEASKADEQLPEVQDEQMVDEAVAMDEELPSIEAPPADEAVAMGEDHEAAAAPPVDETMDWEEEGAATKPAQHRRRRAVDFFDSPQEPLSGQTIEAPPDQADAADSDDTMDSKLSRNQRIPDVSGSDSEAVVSENSQDSLLSRNQKGSKQRSGAAHDTPAGSGAGDAASADSDVVTPTKRRSQLANNKSARGKAADNVVDLTLDSDPSSPEKPQSPKGTNTAPVAETAVQPKIESPENTRPEWPREDDIVAIHKLTSGDVEKLAAEEDRLRLLTWLVTHAPVDLQEKAFKFTEGRQDNEMIHDVFEAIRKIRGHAKKIRSLDSDESEGCFAIATWYVCWKACHRPNQQLGLPLSMTDSALDTDGDKFGEFYNSLIEIILLFKQQMPFPQREKPPNSRKLAMKRKGNNNNSDDESNAFWTKELGQSKAIKQPKPKKGKKFQPSQAGIDLREGAQKRAAQRKVRATALRKTLGPDRLPGSQQGAIVNLSHQDDEDDIAVDQHIASRIHQHQIEGVQFLWDEVVSAGSGCLLAHTMGLGKTMQCITFLVTLAGAAQNPNERISKQVPAHLRDLRALILCPPALVQNWHDELLMWIPHSCVIGIENVRQLTSSLTLDERLYELYQWRDEGGILLMPYTLLSALTFNKTARTGESPLSAESHEEVKQALLEGPSIVIADEAHAFKNASSQASQAVHQLATRSRIALTGSPLSNHLEEYFSIVNWVEKGYLGNLTEFKMTFTTPIMKGLYQESSRYEQRVAIRKLAVLKQDLEPKVHRADYSVLRDSLQGLTEFIIRVPLTDIQKQCYARYVDSVANGTSGGLTFANLWARIAILTLLCAHPKCYQDKLLGREEKSSAQISRKKSPSAEGAPKSQDDIVDEGEEIAEQTVENIGLDASMVTEQKALLDQVSKDLSSSDLSYKMKILMAIVDLTEETGEKLLIFSQRLPVLSFVEAELKRRGKATERLDGKGNVNNRQKLTRNFNQGSTRIMLISTRAGGTGLNLQAANRVVILDFHFNPVHEQQAIGRAYRIGQQRHVYVYRLVIGGSFEDTLLNQGFFKIGLGLRVVDKKDLKQHAKGDLLSYMEPFKEPPQEDLQRFMGDDPLVMDRILARQAEDPFIRSIKPAETFLEEKTEELTKEEQEEAAREMQRIRLRRTDPEAFRRLQQQELQDAARRQASAPQPLPPQLTAPQPLPPQSTAPQPLPPQSTAPPPLPPQSTAPQPSATQSSAPPPSAAPPSAAQPMMHKFRVRNGEVGQSVPQPGAAAKLNVGADVQASRQLLRHPAQHQNPSQPSSENANPQTPARRSSPLAAARPDQTSTTTVEDVPMQDLHPPSAGEHPSQSPAGPHQVEAPSSLRNGTPQPVRPPREPASQPPLPSGNEAVASSANLSVAGQAGGEAFNATSTPAPTPSPNSRRNLATIWSTIRNMSRAKLKSLVNSRIRDTPDLPEDCDNLVNRFILKTEKKVFADSSMSESRYNAKMVQIASGLDANKIRAHLFRLVRGETDSLMTSMSNAGTPRHSVPPEPSRAASRPAPLDSTPFLTNVVASVQAQPPHPADTSTADGPPNPSPVSTNAVDLAAREPQHPSVTSTAADSDPSRTSPATAPRHSPSRAQDQPQPPRAASSTSNADLAALSNQSSSAQTPAFPHGPPGEPARTQAGAASTSTPMNPVQPPRRPAGSNGRGGPRPRNRSTPTTPRAGSQVSPSVSNASRPSASSNPFRRPPSTGTARGGAASSGYAALDRLQADESRRGRRSSRGRNRADGNASTHSGRRAR